MLLDPGEECDCGRPDYCSNTCCNPLTCKFSSPEVKCSSGSCCDLTVNDKTSHSNTDKSFFFLLFLKIEM